MTEKYNASNVSLEQILSYIKSGEIAIPEIQRPFVWKPRQVRDLIDSLYMGYPTGYLIISQSPDMRLKDGSMSIGKKIMIDGQQRVTALMTSIVGLEVLGSDFKKRRIKIAFNPQASVENDEEVFKVQDNAVLKDKKWISDIAELFKPDFDQWEFVNEYCQQNPDVNGSQMNKILMRLLDIKNRQIGVITLDKDLNIDEVTEIFIRINSQGAKLNQADFATLLAQPHVVVDRIELFLNVLRSIEIIIVFLFVELEHLFPAIRAFTLVIAIATHRPQH